MGLLNKVYNLVWYGDCSDPECQTINLSAWTDDIDFVFQVSDVNNGWKHWSAQTDGVSLSDFDQLVCGIPYVIKLKSDDKVNPNNPIDIPDVVVGTFAQDEDDTTPRRITEYCNPVRDCSFITDEPTDGRFDLTINMSTLDSAGTNGFIRGIEIEFADNVELDDTEVVSVTFDQKYIMALGAGDTENSTLFKELADRSKTMLTFGSVSNKRNKFGFMDLREAGQGISYETEKRSNFRFKIPYKSLDGDVRVVSAKIYDTSVDRKVYDYVLCDPIVGPCIECDTWQGEGTSFTYPLSTTSVASAEHNLSAIWYDTESENAKLCYGDSDPELPKTYYAFFNEEKIPRGAITITGKLKGDKRIAYVKGEEIFIGLPGVEMADGADYEIDVYRFTPCGNVEPSDTPTPTSTNTKTPTKTPTKTETPSQSKTETPENLEATPTPSKTKTPSKTPTKTKTPSKSKSITPEKQIDCCEELNELDVPVSSDSINLTDNITAMPFVHGGKLCLGELTEGFPSSVTLYIKLNEEMTVYLGTLGIFGSFNSANNTVRFVITQLSDDASDLEKELNEDCLEGTINANGDCVLQNIIPNEIRATPTKTITPSKSISSTKTPSESKSNTKTPTPDEFKLEKNIPGHFAFGQAGTSVSINDAGDVVAIGNPGSTGINKVQGGVQIARYSGGSWQIDNILSGYPMADSNQSGVKFGYSVKLNATGNILVVSLPRDTTSGGSVRVYEYKDNAWSKMGDDFRISGGGNECGRSVDINDQGNTLIFNLQSNTTGVGPTYKPNRGGVVAFYWNGLQWTQRGDVISLYPNGTTTAPHYGLNSVVSVSNNLYVAVGLKTWNKVKIYQYTTSGLTFKKDISGPSGSTNFGCSVSFDDSGQYLVVGSHGTPAQTQGSVYLYNTSNKSNPSLIKTFNAPTEQNWNGNAFGSSVSISGDAKTIIIGSTHNNNQSGGSPKNGFVCIYRQLTSAYNWGQIGNTILGTANSLTGFSVTLNKEGSVVVVGSTADTTHQYDPGATRIYRWG